jgi:hypothetical protein
MKLLALKDVVTGLVMASRSTVRDNSRRHRSGSPPRARPARRKDDFVQAGLLARGSSPISAFPDLAWQGPVARKRRAHRRQLRGQLRICLAVEAAWRTGFPLGRST